MIIENLKRYAESVPEHRYGTLEYRALSKIQKYAGDVRYSVETGCGKSTILLSQISKMHDVFCIDDNQVERGSLSYVKGCPDFKSTSVRFVFGPTHRTLPIYKFEHGIDLALIDGPHGYPYPDIEYAYISPHLNVGALLIIDDIHIPTVRKMFEIVVEDKMFELLDVEKTTAYLQRTKHPKLETDSWWTQNYNKTRFQGFSRDEDLT